MTKKIFKKLIILFLFSCLLISCTDFFNCKKINFEPTKKTAYATNCILFTSESSFILSTEEREKYWDGKLFYTTDLITWHEWFGEFIKSTENYICVRGLNNTYITGKTPRQFVFSGDKGVYCYGNIMTLLDYKKVKNNQEIQMAPGCFKGLFSQAKNLLTSPDLTATKLSKNCYSYMFWNCISLIELPVLPIAELQDNCYENMFEDCKQIKIYESKPNDGKEYYEWNLPDNLDNSTNYYTEMFSGTSGSFTDTPKPGKTYYILRVEE